MKKLLALLLCCVMTISFAACDSKDDDKDTAKAKVTVSEDDKETTKSDDKKDDKKDDKDDKDDDDKDVSAKGEMTLDSFIKLCDSQISSLNKTYESQGISVKLISRDNSLVYQFKYGKQVDDSMLDTMKTTFESAMTSNASVYTGILTQVQGVVPDTKSVVVEYLNADGSMIYTKEFN